MSCPTWWKLFVKTFTKSQKVAAEMISITQLRYYTKKTTTTEKVLFCIFRPNSPTLLTDNLYVMALVLWSVDFWTRFSSFFDKRWTNFDDFSKFCKLHFKILTRNEENSVQKLTDDLSFIKNLLIHKWGRWIVS